MCVIFFAIEQDWKRPLILLANRDEFYDRPTAKAAAWEDHPNIYGGRDMLAGGTWLGITDSGRFAAVTNYRDPTAPIGMLSRGGLVSEFLAGEMPAADYLRQIELRRTEYSGFNLIAGQVADGVEVSYYSNRGNGIAKLGQGIYGLSNHLLDTPWPKVIKGKSRMSELLSNGGDRESMFKLLSDPEKPKDAELPDTGIGIEKERALSSIFIETPNYGTRCSTVVTADGNGKFDFEERVFV